MSPKRQKFIEEYPIDLNATQAAIRAGFSAKTAYSQGQRLLKNVEVAAAIAEARAKSADKAEITRDWIMERLRLNALQCAAPGETYSPAASNKALELLGKERAMFIDRRLVGVRNIDDLSEEQILEILGGEPEPAELSAAARLGPVGHA